MTSPLENLVGPNKPLATEEADPGEINGLIRSAWARTSGGCWAAPMPPATCPNTKATSMSTSAC